MGEHIHEYGPDYIVSPGDIIKDYIDNLEMTQADLSDRCGLSKKTINEIIAGKAPVTPETSLKLEKVLGRPAHFWNNLELIFKDKKARLEEQKKQMASADWLKTIPVKILIERGYLTLSNNPSINDKLSAVFNFYGVASVSAWETVWSDLKVAARKAPRAKTEMGAASAWIRQGQIIASKIECAPYNKASFRAILPAIRTLTLEAIPVWTKRIEQLCASCGVAVAFVPEIPKVPWNGLTQWLSPQKALIILSIRGKGEDKFWFTFFHEACHVLNEDSKKAFLINSEDYKESEEEKRADKYAADFLIPSSENERIISAKTKKDICTIAENLQIAPGIVAGRYQHLTGKWQWFHDLIRPLKWQPNPIC